MKVYELMNVLSNMPCGAEVRFRRVMDKDEIHEYVDDPEMFEVDFSIKEASLAKDNLVQLDGWAE